MAKTMLRVGDPKKPTKSTEAVDIPTGKTSIDVDFDLRDKLSELVTRGNTLAPDDKKAIYGFLTARLGEGRAQKIMDHAYIFNTRPEVQKLPLEEKIKSFYTIGSNDPDVSDVITRTKSLGYGVGPGFRESVSALNQETAGRISPTAAAVTPEVQRRIMLKVNR